MDSSNLPSGADGNDGNGATLGSGANVSNPTSGGSSNFRSRFLDVWFSPHGRHRHGSGSDRSISPVPTGSGRAEEGASGAASPATTHAGLSSGEDSNENGSSWGSAYAKCYARRQEKFRRNEKVMANIQGKIPKSEQLFKAIQQGKVEMVRELTRKGGVDVNTRFVGGSHPLASAVVCSQREIVKWLVEQGADCNQKDGTGTTPLHLSVQWNWVSDSVIIDFLLSGDADPNIFNEHGETPLHSAIKRHRRSHVQKFLTRGGNPNKGVIPSGKTPTMLAAESGQLDILHTLIETYKADWRQRDRIGNTLLHHAALSGHAPIVDYLLKNGIPPNVTNGDKVTPIRIAVEKGYTLIVASLLSHGAGISLQYRLLLDLAARCRNADILHLLFLHGAKSSSDLIFSTLEDSLLNYVDNEAWVPVFRILLQATGCLQINDGNDEILYRASLKSSELVGSAIAASAAAASVSSRELTPLGQVLLLIAIAGYTFNTRCLNAARVEGDPFDRAPGDAGAGGSGGGAASSVVSSTHSSANLRPLKEGAESPLSFPFPSLYRSLVYLQYDNPRTLKEWSCLGIRHCTSHASDSNVFHFVEQLPLPKVIRQNVVDLCETLTLY